MQQIRPGDLVKAGYVEGPTEESTIHIGKRIRPVGNAGSPAMSLLGVHSEEKRLDDLVRIGSVPFAHPLNGQGEKWASRIPWEDTCVLREEAEDEPRHEVIHVGPALLLVPVWIVLAQLDVKFI